MSVERDELKEWLRAVLDHMGWSGAEMARRIRKPASTINRFLNDPDATHTLSTTTLRAVESATGFAPLVFPGQRRAGFAEPDAAPYQAEESARDPALDIAVRAFCEGRPGVDPWVLRSRALEGAGYLPGDVLIVDLNARPKAQDVVCAQLYDWRAGRAETVMRIYEPPCLISLTGDPALQKPFVVDDERVVIKGVVIRQLRARRAMPDAA